jgi:hypothetical protein
MILEPTDVLLKIWGLQKKSHRENTPAIKMRKLLFSRCKLAGKLTYLLLLLSARFRAKPTTGIK